MGKAASDAGVGFHIRRQAPFRNYILDFVCYDGRLVIEVDGSQHAWERGLARDVIRDAVLEDEGFQVLRVWNDDVNRNIDGVMQAIFETLSQRSPTRAPSGPTLPTRGRER